MIEKLILIENIEPIDFYGINNKKFNKMVGYFPKLKIIGRGTEIKVAGEESEIIRFEEKINLLIDYYHRFNKLSEYTIEKIMEEDNGDFVETVKIETDVILYGNKGRAIKARNKTQFQMVEEINTNDLLFAVGPAGTGKTYLAVALAVRALKEKQVRRIILTRPAVEAGEHLGFLPGDLKEKLDPYLQPLYDALTDMIPYKKLNDCFEEGVLEIAPLAFMRGRTLANAFVILDEAQNATSAQIKMFLTRMGENSKFIVTGDLTQIDLPNKKSSGLLKAVNILQDIQGISILNFNEKDIIRHRLVRNIVEAYEKNND
ncbi:MAG: phosphate starvation-inducible protein PhoH [Bacteroidetes bacterium GWF2_38_335]|nr:MAG: phosphate starvation-inducible protein PhoH [Bacteroidetes bacterium GWF2_38_335]OFY81804.1 MAG: phosphate starvation-inducible protein PhoH [Bacteroidetes bacterium RIFOXYA12_FULL_38_20]HBS87875.1 phosphate starvation-inducible protein PhoH [Bacteroidales bacterium]